MPGKISEISIVFLVFAENFIVNFASEGNKTKLFRITAIFPQKLLIYTELLYFLMLCATMKANKPYHLIWVIYPEKAMDNIDIKILNLLKQNARMSASEIGEKINLSVSAVLERIKKLEKSGIIKQYTLILDPKLINQDVSAFISIGLDHPKYNESFIESVLDHKQIAECHYITGDSDFLLKVVIDSTASLGKVLNDIKSIRGVSRTRTLVVLSTVKNEYTVLPDTL